MPEAPIPTLPPEDRAPDAATGPTARLTGAGGFRIVPLPPQPERIDWGLRSVGVAKAWRRTRGAGIRVAVVDSGIARGHPDLRGAVEASLDLTEDGGAGDDRAGHGTHVAGIVAARQDGAGVVGIAPEATLLNAKITDRLDRDLPDEAIAEGIAWAAARGADVVCLSLSGPAPLPRTREAIREAAHRSPPCFVICAVGPGPGVGWPAAEPETIAVGSVRRAGNGRLYPALDSAAGPRVDVVAPGSRILSTFPPNRYALASGTSMAAPFVAGVAALLLAHRGTRGSPIRDVEHLRRSLARTARDVYMGGWDAETGWGLVNPARLVEAG